MAGPTIGFLQPLHIVLGTQFAQIRFPSFLLKGPFNCSPQESHLKHAGWNWPPSAFKHGPVIASPQAEQIFGSAISLALCEL
jgi:hypothetical protein